MKSCPHCQSTYEDWIEFCFNDGIPLVIVENKAPAPPPRPPPAPAPAPGPAAAAQEARLVSGADLPEPANLSRFNRSVLDAPEPRAAPKAESPLDLPSPRLSPPVAAPVAEPVVPAPAPVEEPAPAPPVVSDEEPTTIPEPLAPPVEIAAPVRVDPPAPEPAAEPVVQVAPVVLPEPVPVRPEPAPSAPVSAGPPGDGLDPDALKDLAAALDARPEDDGTRPFLPPVPEESEDAKATIPMYTPTPEPKAPAERSALDDDGTKAAAGAGIGLALMGFIGLFALVGVIGVGAWWMNRGPSAPEQVAKVESTPAPTPAPVAPPPAPVAPPPAEPVVEPVVEPAAEVTPPPVAPVAATPPATPTTTPVATRPTTPAPTTTPPRTPTPTTPTSSTPRATAPVDNSASVTSDSVWGEAAAPTSGSLRIVTDPDGATVYVNDVSKGKTPVVVELPYGAHQVKVVRAGYKTEVRDVNIRVRDLTVPITLKPEVVTGQVNVYGPDGYRVMVDGHDMGLMPVTVQVSEGVRSFKLVGPDGASCTLTREVKFKAQGRPETITLACP